MKRDKLHEIIFGAETPAGRGFDVLLLWAISLSVLVVILESVNSFEVRYGDMIKVAEWIFTILFTIEYVVRIYCSPRPVRYIFSFFGLVDLLAIVPTYLSLLISGSQYLLVVRIFRLLRIFRVLKMTRYLGEAEVLIVALKASRPKIIVFVGTILSLVTIIGSIMYLIEGPESGFTSIPQSCYWAIITLTTVGYGDIVPVTPLGQLFASVVTIMGYGVIAVPTGIVSVELSRATQLENTNYVSSKKAEQVVCECCGQKIR